MILYCFHRARSRLMPGLIACGLLLLASMASAQSDAPAARIEIREQSPYGSYLTDREGRSLYLFEQDERGGSLSTCVDACANSWPPYTTTGEPVAGQGVDPAKLGTIERDGEMLQVTYAGWPLYYFNGDKQPGDALGQDVEHLGGEWYLIAPTGEKVTHGGRTEEPDTVRSPRQGQNGDSRLKNAPGQDDDA